MRTTFRRWLSGCFLAGLLGGVGTCAEAEEGFESLFDGRTLTGWQGQDMSFWSVEDGAITGTIRPDHAPPMNQYLIWQGGLLQDFELKLTFRLTGSNGPDVNGGFQYRSRRLPNGDVAGYQVDNNFGQPWKVRLYDEFGRHDLALEGERTVFAPDGRKLTEPLVLESGAGDFRLDEWHEYHLSARGRELTLRINGKPVATVTDSDDDSFEAAGYFAPQLHTGPPMKAQFKDIRLKRLVASRPLSAREALWAEATLHWQLGERLEAHQPPLKAVGSIAAGVPAQGLGARPGARVARFEQAYFDLTKDLNTPKRWNLPGDAATVHVRARMGEGQWTTTLLSKGGGPGHVHFRLFGADRPETPGPDVGFEIQTERGHFQVSFPVARIEPAAWHDLMGWYDGRKLRVLCDGRVMAEGLAEGKLTPNEALLLIGAVTEGDKVGQRFTGEMEEVGLWTRALTDAEVTRLCAPQ